MLELLRRAIPWLVAGLLFVSGYWVADNKWEAKVSNDYITKLEATEQQRRSVQSEVDRVSKDFQDQMSALEGSSDRIVADLQSDNKRLRLKVSTKGRTKEDISRCFPDGYADLDEGDAKRLISIGLKGDAWIKALQDTVRALQQKQEVNH